MLSLIVGLYLAVLLGIGWWCHRTRISGMTDFLLAGRRLGVPLCAAAMAATHFGGGAVIGGASYGFEHGLSGAWYGIATGVGLLLLALLTASRFRALALYTVPDFLEQRFGSRLLRVLGATLSLVALVGILAAQVSAARAAFAITGLDPTVAAIIAAIVFVVYTAFGGLWAAAISDLFQIVVAGLGVVFAAVVVLLTTSKQGGMQSMLTSANVGDAYFDLFGAGPALILWLLLPTVMYTLIGQDFYQRLFAAKSAAVARTSAVVGGVVLIVLSVFPVIIGMGAHALGGTDDPSQSVPWVLQNLVNPLLGGIILAAILAAIMSSADSLLTSATSHVVKDLWIETLHRGQEFDERRMLVLSRAVTVVVGAAALVIGLVGPGIVTILIYSYTLYTAGVFVPVIGGLLWKRGSTAAALSALFIGSAIAIVGVTTEISIAGAPVEVIAALISAAVFVVVSVVVPQAEHR